MFEKEKSSLMFPSSFEVTLASRLWHTPAKKLFYRLVGSELFQTKTYTR